MKRTEGLGLSCEKYQHFILAGGKEKILRLRGREYFKNGENVSGNPSEENTLRMRTQVTMSVFS